MSRLSHDAWFAAAREVEEAKPVAPRPKRTTHYCGENLPGSSPAWLGTGGGLWWRSHACSGCVPIVRIERKAP